MAIKPVSGEIKAQAINDNLSYLDSKFDQINGGPKETFTSLSALIAKYPNGANSAMLITEADGSNGYLYTWNGSTWIKGPLYQAQGIADKSITENKLNFPAIEGEKSKNLFNKETVKKGFYLNDKGVEVASENWNISSLIEWPDNQFISFTPTSFFCAYDANGIFTFGQSVISSPISKPAGSVYFKICYNNSIIETAMVNAGNTLFAYDDYRNKIDPITIKPKSIVKQKLAFNAVEVQESINLFNKNNVEKGFYLDKNGNKLANQNWNISHKIECVAGDKINFTATSFLNFYSASDVHLKGIDTVTSPQIAPENVAYFKICYKTIDLDIAMVNFGDTLLPYQSFAMPLDKNVSVSASQIVDGAGTTNLDIIYARKIYTVANDLTSLPFERNYQADLVLDHMLDLGYDEKIDFENGIKVQSFVSPIINDGTDNGWIINSNQDVLITDKVINFKSPKYAIDSVAVKHVSTKASVGKAKKAFVLTIGDSLTNGHLIDINRPDKVLDDQMVYWSKIKQLAEMDKIEAGDNANDFNWFLMGQKSRRKVQVNYKGTNKIVNAGGEGYGGWSLYSILRHQNRLNPSQETWDYLNLGNGTGTDYTGSPAQKDLIASTNETFTGKPVNPFFDNDKTGANKFSITKYLARYRTMDNNGNRLALADCGEYVDESTRLNCDIATPTHVILQMGANDLGRTSLSKFLSNIKEFVATVRAELPECFIGISIAPDYAGTLFPSNYPEFNNCKIDLNGHKSHYQNAKQLNEWIDTVNEVNDKLYLIPSYFVQPSAYSTPFIEYKNLDGIDRRLIKTGAGPDIHPNYIASDSWAYQMYAWIKYTLK